jgi:hypothetical protein
MRSLDLLDSNLVQWRDASVSAGTSGIDSARLTYTTASRIRNLLSNPGSVRLTYAFTAGNPNALAAFEVDPAFADTMRWTRTGDVLQAYLYGDGSGNDFRFTVDDSVEAFPGGPAGHREASRWIPVTWVGWRMVTWDCERDTAGSWTGNGVLEGSLRFRGIQIRKDAGSSILSSYILVDLLQLATRTGVVGVPTEPGDLPLRIALEQNFPNPFNPTTTIRFQLPAASDVKLVVYDLLGREVAVLVNESKGRGRYEVTFDGTNISSGMYIYRMTAGKYGESRKLVLTK